MTPMRRLSLGFLPLLLLACGTPQGSVRLEQVAGTAAWVRGGKIADLREGATLGAGEALRLESGEARLEIRESPVRGRGEGTSAGRIELSAPARIENARETPGLLDLALGAGTARVSLASATPRLILAGPGAALLFVEPGEAIFSVAEDGACLIAVRGGRGVVRTGDRPPIPLARGEEVEVAPNGAPGRVHRAILNDANDARIWGQARKSGLAGRQDLFAGQLRERSEEESARLRRLAGPMEEARRAIRKGRASPEEIERARQMVEAARTALTRRASARYLATVLSSTRRTDEDNQDRPALRALARLEAALEVR